MLGCFARRKFNELDTFFGFVSLQENIDTTTSGGKLVFYIFGALAEFERDIIRDRTQAGLHAARARGRQGGRPPKLNKKQIAMVKKLMKDETNSIKDICATLNISKTTLYRYCEPKIITRNNKQESILEDIRYRARLNWIRILPFLVNI